MLQGQAGGPLAVAGDDQRGDLHDLAVSASGRAHVALGGGQVRLAGGQVALIRGQDREQSFGDRVHDGSVRGGAEARLTGD